MTTAMNRRETLLKLLSPIIGFFAAIVILLVIVVAVGESTDVQFVENGIFVPERVGICVHFVFPQREFQDINGFMPPPF